MTAPIDFAESAKHYTLSIRLSTDGFSFSVCGSSGDGGEVAGGSFEVNVQHSLAANVKQFLAQTGELRHVYRRVNVLMHTDRYTVMPLDLYEDSMAEKIFSQNLPRRNNEVVLCNVLGRSGAAVLFGIDKLSHLFLAEQFPGARFFATVSPLMEYFSEKSRKCDCRCLFAHPAPGMTDVVAFDRGRLQLANTYLAAGDDDRCFYLLSAWKSLGYSQEDDRLCLAGISAADAGRMTGRLEKFVRHVDVVEAAGGLPFDMQLLMLCE